MEGIFCSPQFPLQRKEFFRSMNMYDDTETFIFVHLRPGSALICTISHPDISLSFRNFATNLKYVP